MLQCTALLHLSGYNWNGMIFLFDVLTWQQRVVNIQKGYFFINIYDRFDNRK